VVPFPASRCVSVEGAMAPDSDIIAQCTLAYLKKRSRWLLAHAFDVTSQAGEDGIISKALSAIADRNFWCVEFGAWDGKHLSNTYNLIENYSYHGVLIEADPKKYSKLLATYQHPDRIIPINASVGFSSDDTLDAILAPCGIPKDFDLLSIDIDGNDYHVWNAISSFRPKIVLVEYNPTISNSVTFVQRRAPDCSQGSSAAALVALGKAKAYELIAVTHLNLIFVAQEYFHLFDIPDNSLEVMRDDSATPQVFVGYDGRIFVGERNSLGQIHLPWHDIVISEVDLQALPKCLQKYPYNYTGLERLAFAFFCLFNHPQTLVRYIRRRLSTTRSEK